jgi:hypothetical protein
MMKYVVALSLLMLSLHAEDPPSKKVKPHFAGARRAPEVKKVSSRPKKVKNQWFSSKTQPKIEKKDEGGYEEVTALPQDHPYLVAQATPTPIAHSAEVYPRTGVAAPRGHLFLTAEWLYWMVREEGTEFVTERNLTFDYTSGIRAGLGVHLPYTDGWDIYATYSYFAPSTSKSVEGSFYPLFLFQGAGSHTPTVTSADAHWSIQFQVIDWAFGRAFYLAPSLSVHPFAGMKGAWIDQHAHVHYKGGSIPDGETFTTHFTNDFAGAGPLLGLDSNWHWGAGFSLLGTLSSSLVIGNFDTKQTQDQLSADVVDYHHGFNLVSPMVQMALSLAWDRNFNQERSHFGMNIGFESQYWWSQNQTELFTGADMPSYQRQKGDLALYGLILGARFDF